jgi:hypothetical protein
LPEAEAETRGTARTEAPSEAKMERRQAPTFVRTKRRRERAAAAHLAVNEPNFGLLASDASWRNSWVAIVAGKFSSSPYSGLLFVEHTTAYAELYDTDGEGRIRAPFRRKFDPLGGRSTWTHIVPGLFGPSGFTGLLLYDRTAGVGRFYDCNGEGDFILKGEYSGWPTSWTHIVTGRFVASSPYSSVFFYSASENYGEIWATDGSGLAGVAPYQTFQDFWDSAFTHVVAGDFHWTPGPIVSVPTLTDLFFYDGRSGHGEMYRCDMVPDSPESNIVLTKAAVSDSLPQHVNSVVAGNFGGLGNTDLAFYDGSAGTLSFVTFEDVNDTSANLVLRETQSGLRRTATDFLVAGNFWMANPDDHWFGDGPQLSGSRRFDPDWRFGTGTFTDLLLYDRAAGLGEFYFHEPLAPPAEPLAGYITSRTSLGGASLATGSVLPGESIAIHVSSQEGPYSINIYRQGVFGDGQTEEMMAAIDGLPAEPTPLEIARNAYKDGAQWPEVANFVVPDWPSGFYLARAQTIGTPSQKTDIPFVVRARPGARSGILFVVADTTYAAYNDWGGRNSYGHVTGAQFAGAFPSTSALRIPFGFELSFERPFHGGFGNAPEAWEIPFLQWLARMDVAVDVCTSRDLHFEAPGLDEHRLLLFVGHHEYWTAQMRTHVEDFARAGGNVGFFSGNVCWWQIRLNADGTQLQCYKVADFDPVSTTDDHALTTVHWFDDLVKRPETTLTGVSWLGDGGIFNDQQHRFVMKRPDHWAFAGTGLTRDQKFGGYSSTPGGPEDRSVAGPETDRAQADGPNGLNSPANFTLASIYDLTYCNLEVGTMGTFRPAEGSGEVFNAPTLNWASGLTRTADGSNVIDQITLNVIKRLGPWMSISDGQSMPGAPVAAVPWRRSFALFIADSAGGIYTTGGDPREGFGPWASVSEGRSTAGAPVTAVPWGNRFALFIADPAGGIYTAGGDPQQGFGPWASVSEGQSTPGAPVTAVPWGNRFALFIADPGGGIYTCAGDPQGGFGPWASVSEGSSAPGASVTAVPWGDRFALFIADPAGGIYTCAGDPQRGFGPWASVSEGRSTPGAPVSAVPWRDGFALFLADPAGGIYTCAGDPQRGFGPWSSVSEGVSTPGARVTAVITAPDRIALFLVDPGGDVYMTSGNADDGWGPWTGVWAKKSTPGAPIAAVVGGSNRVTLFFADRKGGIYATYRD